jgi:thiol-disulfide isomerase/thioredoxin
MSVLNLTSNDFYIDDGTKGKVLCSTRKGIVFVMFHLNESACPNCHTVMPEFLALPKHIPSIQYATVNLSNYPDIAKKSGLTLAPIKYVPYLILYVNGRPWLRWDNEKTLAAMANFLKDILPRIPKNLVDNSSSSGPNKSSAEEKPVFQGGGIPYNVVCDKSSGVCYLSFEDFRNSARQ